MRRRDDPDSWPEATDYFGHVDEQREAVSHDIEHPNLDASIAWRADVGPGVHSWEFEGLTRAAFDLSAVSLLAASWESRETDGTDDSWNSISDQYRDARNERIRVRLVRYENPYDLEIAIIGATPALLTATAAVATLLMTGSALRRKYLAEARKANADANRAEYDLRAIEAAGAAGSRGEFDEIPPEADGTWEDVGEMLGGGTRIERLTGILRGNGSFSRNIVALRSRGFRVGRLERN